MNNLQIEVKRHKLNQQFLEQIEFGNHSPCNTIAESERTDLKRLDNLEVEINILKEKCHK